MSTGRPKNELASHIFKLYKEDYTPTEAHRQICAQFGPNSISPSCVRNWFSRFSKGVVMELPSDTSTDLEDLSVKVPSPSEVLPLNIPIIEHSQDSANSLSEVFLV